MLSVGLDLHKRYSQVEAVEENGERQRLFLVRVRTMVRDSGSVTFSGGNPVSLIGTWSLAPLP
jgi:hypothetical protein